jgi:hypothetical protein
MLVLDAGELLEVSMSFIDEMHLVEMRTSKLLFLGITGCEDLKSLRVSAPGLKEITYCNTPAFIPSLCVWRLEVQLITHKEEEDDNDEYSSEHDENDEYGSNIYNLLRLFSSSVRCLLMHLYVPEVRIYIYLLATFKSDPLLLTIFIFQLHKASASVNPLLTEAGTVTRTSVNIGLTEADASCHLSRLID